MDKERREEGPGRPAAEGRAPASQDEGEREAASGRGQWRRCTAGGSEPGPRGMGRGAPPRPRL